MKAFLASTGNADDRHPSAVWKNAHLWYIALIMIACSLFYYLDSILGALGWAIPQWNILYMPHDFHRLLFAIPVLYASYMFRIRSAVITASISMAIFLPRALFISPYAEPLFRPLFFCIALGTVAVFGAKLLDEATAHKKAEEALQRCTNNLEITVAERTAELEKTTDKLRNEITKHKRAEKKIRTSLRDNQALLQEVHHRVRNNLQVISSLLDMSSLRIHEQQAIASLTDARTRIHLMSLIHSQLYQNESPGEIEMGAHVRELAKYLAATYARGENIAIVIDISRVYFPLNQAIPCALALGELISNALRHAFKEEEKGTIEISMRRSDEGIINIRVKDDGIGIPNEGTINKAGSLGLNLCRNLIQKQLKGQIQVRRNKGTEFIIEFKMQGKERGTNET